MAKPKPTTTQPAPSSNIADILAAIKGAGIGSTTQAQTIGGSRFYSLAEPSTFGIWNEATGLDTVHDQRPLYVQGDEWTQLPTDGAQLAALQHQLVAAGYMSDDNIVFGSPDQKTANAMAQLLGTSNAQGTVWQTSLANRLTQAGQQPAPQRQIEPLVIKLKNPDDIRSVIQSGAQQVYGKYLAPDDVEKFVNAYQQQDTAAQTQAYNMQVAGQPNTTAGTVIGPPTTAEGINREFSDQFTAAHPTEARTGIFASKLDEIIKDLIGPKL